MDPIFYRFTDKKWTETKKLTQLDVALIVDGDNKLIYIFEGEYSTPKTQVEAKTSLGSIKMHYKTYNFKRIEKSTPELIQTKLKEALKDSDEINAKKQRNAEQFEISIRVFMGLSLIIGGVMLLLWLLKINQEVLDAVNQGQSQANILTIEGTSLLRFLYLQSILGLVFFASAIVMAILSGLLKLKTRTVFFCSLALVGVILIFGFWHHSLIDLAIIPTQMQLDAADYLYLIIISASFVFSMMILSILGTYVQHISLPKKVQSKEVKV